MFCCRKKRRASIGVGLGGSPTPWDSMPGYNKTNSLLKIIRGLKFKELYFNGCNKRKTQTMTDKGVLIKIFKFYQARFRRFE